MRVSPWAVECHGQQVPSSGVVCHRGRRLANFVQSEEEQSQGKEALADTPINLTVEKLKAEHPGDEQVTRCIRYPGRKQLHRDGHADASAHKHSQHLLWIEPARMQHLERQHGKCR